MKTPQEQLRIDLLQRLNKNVEKLLKELEFIIGEIKKDPP